MDKTVKGVPLCELKGWPKIKFVPIDDTFNDVRNYVLCDVGNKRLTFDLEAFAKALYEGRYPYGSWADRKDYQRTYWINKARRLAEPAIKSIHLSDGEGNDA